MSDFSSSDSHVSSFFTKKELMRPFVSDGTTVEASPVRLIHSVDAPMTSDLNSSEVKDSRLDSETFCGYVDPIKSNKGPSLVESPSSRKKRLQRERVRRCRAKRSKKEAENAKKYDPQWRDEKRAMESAFERSKRRRSDAMKKAFSREAETEVRWERLAKDVIHHSNTRVDESADERQRRLRNDTMGHSEVRQNESVVERERRLNNDALRHSEVRQCESVEEKQNRLLTDTLRHSDARQHETADERQIRTQKNAARMKKYRQKKRVSEVEAKGNATKKRKFASESESSENHVPFWKQKDPSEFEEFGQKCLDSFHKVMSKLEFKTCTSCDESWPTLRMKANTEMCWQCSIDHGSDQAGLLTSDNNMNPGSVPPLLKDLSTVEEMLIAQIAPMMNVFRLPSGRQYGYSGHVLNLPQDVQSVVNSLPRTASNLGTVVVRRKRSSGNVMEFRVRRDRVYAALVFLKRNNKYYSNIKIDS